MIPPFFLFPLLVPAWIMLGFWFLWQLLIPQVGVANWAHIGGFVAGMLTVLFMGGSRKILRRMMSRTMDLTERDENFYNS
jgi:membrane associated rhomboid family serine protease